MALTVNLRHLEAHDLSLEGELSVEELDIDNRDEVIQVKHPLFYGIEVQNLESGLLVQGKLSLTLECQCVRCLKPFQYELSIDDWKTLLPFEGEESVVVANDCVDLTPYMREDILLEFPQHPLCQPECRGLPGMNLDKQEKSGSSGKTEAEKSAWSDLNKLKF